ncbi:MAG: hypothetical protein EAZ89_09050 [Bacteroidetes bacterium]|nr:MAG: hypothetical protein EAZ89_09050 [Bacteroidota bacterium]
MRERFENAHVPPAPELWTAIESRIGSDRKSRRFPLFWAWIGADLFAAALMFAVLHSAPAEKPAADTHMALHPAAPVEQPIVPNLPEKTPQKTDTHVRAAEFVSPAAPHMQIQLPEADVQQALPEADALEVSATLGSASSGPVEMRPEPLPLQPYAIAAELSPAAHATPFSDPYRMRRLSWRVYGGVYQRSGGSSERQAAADGFSSDLLAADYSKVEAGFDVSTNAPSNDLYAVRLPRKHVTLGFMGEYALSKRLSVMAGAGLSVSDKGYYVKGTLANGTANLPLVDDNDSLLRQYLLSGSVALGPRQYFNDLHLEIPVMLRYEVLHRSRHSLSLTAGISFQQRLTLIRTASVDALSGPGAENQNLVAPPITLENLNTSGNTPLLTLHPSHFRAQAALLYEYRLSRRVGIFVGPSLGYNLSTPYSGPAATGLNPMRIGIEAGVRLF